MGRRLKLGMIGGGQGAFIGAVHRLCARMDDKYEFVAGCLSSTPEKAAKSAEDKISLKAALEISPSYFLKAKNKKTASKIRIVADACFR